jgi:hypothetical protein
MYTLTIDDHGADTITLHNTPAAARATLDIYLELAEYDCRPAQLNSVHSEVAPGWWTRGQAARAV